ncbi:MAG TPA: glycosyltransferase [Candidatus Acidoferrales bacterium]|nr:glycosyltransferase [Candidatus Acidoferrales bacterium]
MPMLALSMIVNNAAADLPECLGSVAGVVDEIVVADSGSSDESIEIARRSGAKTLSIPWENDYAKARNLSLAQVTSDWVLMLDADERLDPDAQQKLPALLANRSVAGYQVTIRNYVADASKKIWDRPSHPNDGSYAPSRSYPAYIDHENVRLFRRDPEIYFVGRVHETVGWRIKDTGRKLGTADFCIHHFGMVRGEDILRKKILFYRDLGQQKIAESPQNAQAHFEVGVVELENLGNPSAALPYFERACELNDRFGVAWFFAGKTQFALGQYAPALRSLRKAESSGHTTPECAELIGDTHYNLGHYEAAACAYRRACKRDSANASLESKLGLAEARNGNTTSGLRKLRHAIGMSPTLPDLYDRLITVEVWLGNLTSAADEAERKLRAVPSRPEDFLRAASIRAKLDDWQQAAALLRQGLVKHPESEHLRARLSKIETPNEPTTMISVQKVTTEEKITIADRPRD